MSKPLPPITDFSLPPDLESSFDPVDLGRPPSFTNMEPPRELLAPLTLHLSSFHSPLDYRRALLPDPLNLPMARTFGLDSMPSGVKKTARILFFPINSGQSTAQVANFEKCIIPSPANGIASKN